MILVVIQASIVLCFHHCDHNCDDDNNNEKNDGKQ